MPKNHIDRIHIGKFYEITDIILGQGSFSKVYLARHKVLGNFVALKVIDKNKIEEEYLTKNLRREASILKKLKHPNIVNFYEEFSHDQLYCLSMELVDGCDLSRFLNKQESRKVSEKLAKVLFYQMASAINYMHKAHVLHRDLKPDNILLEYERVIKIVDFGLSNTYHSHTHLRTHCGSLEYAAPELFVNNSIYGAGVDLWSLGVILYSMVTGKLPFVVPKKTDCLYSTSHKEKFHKRISQGFIEENLKQLENLSYDCRNLLKGLLQPNQHRRLQIRDAYAHPWLQRDRDLKKSLPQLHPDLMRRYKPEIIDWMADRLCVPKKRVQNHLATYRFDLISAIFYIMQDSLVKEALYPPEDMKNSFTFRLNHRRKTTNYDTHESHEEASSRIGHYEATVFQGIEKDTSGVKNYESVSQGFEKDTSRVKPYGAPVPQGFERDTSRVKHYRAPVSQGFERDTSRVKHCGAPVPQGFEKDYKDSSRVKHYGAPVSQGFEKDTSRVKPNEVPVPQGLKEETSRVKHYGTPVSQGFETNQPSRDHHTLATEEACGPDHMRQEGDGGFVFKPRENDPRNAMDVQNGVGDGGHIDRTPNEQLSVLKSNRAFAKEEGNLVLRKDVLKSSQLVSGQTYTVENKPFRSYKHNRPAKAKNTLADSVVETSNGQYKVCEEKHKDKDPVDANENLDHASKSSINLNHQRNLKLLDEKFELKHQLPSKSIKPANKVQVQYKREYKRKSLNGKFEQNNISTNGNRLRDNQTSMNTNPTIGKNSMKIYKAEVDSKDRYRQTQKFNAKLNAREDYKASTICEQIPGDKDDLKQFSSLKSQQHNQTYDKFNRNNNNNTVNAHNKGQYDLRRNPKPAHVEAHRYANEFKKKPTCNKSLAKTKSSSQTQVDVLQKALQAERKEG